MINIRESVYFLCEYNDGRVVKQMVQLVAKNSEAIRGLIESSKKELSVSTIPFPFPRPLDVENGSIQEQLNLFKNNWKEYGIA